MPSGSLHPTSPTSAGPASPDTASSDGAALHVIRPAARLFVPIAPTDTDARAPIAVERCSPLAPGTEVARGGPLVDRPGAFLPLAPTSGTVGALSDVHLIGGRRVRAIELVIDGQDHAPIEESDHTASRDILAGAGPSDLVDWTARLGAGAVWADRTAAPDLAGQLHQAAGQPVDTVVCSLLDADATVRLNVFLVARFAEEVVEAAVLVGRLVGARQVLFAIDQHTAPRRWASLKRAAKGQPVKLVALPGDYPAGDPTLLLYTLLGRKLRPGRSPVDCGAVMFDAPAAVTVGRLLRRGQPMLQTPLAIFDHRTGAATYCVAPVGMTVGDVLAQLHVDLLHATLRAGDLLRDRTITPHSVTGGGEVVVHVTHDPAPQTPDACIRCGWCADVCPTGVHPAAVLGAAQQNDPACARHNGLDACIECGLCTFVCPARLPLLHAIKTMKADRHPMSV